MQVSVTTTDPVLRQLSAGVLALARPSTPEPAAGCPSTAKGAHMNKTPGQRPSQARSPLAISFEVMSRSTMPQSVNCEDNRIPWTATEHVAMSID